MKNRNNDMKDKTIALLKKGFKHELISVSSYIFLGSTGANVLAFLFNLFLAHKLSYIDYGVYSALITIINLVNIPSQSLTTIIVQFASQYLSRKEIGHASALYRKTTVAVVSASLLFCLALLALSG